MSTSSAPTIAIVGAGLSGLVCARILQMNGIEVSVYEAEASAEARSQGGSLDIHTDTGQVALKEAGLYDEFRKHTHPEGESIRVLDKTAKVYVDHTETEGGNGRPEIDRKILRRLFLDSLEHGTIRWGTKITAVRRTATGHELELADGSTVSADLIVGADGAWSKVRTVLTDVRPGYTGITLVEFRITHDNPKHAESVKVTGMGSLFALSDHRYIGGHGGHELYLGLGSRVPEGWAGGIDWDDEAAARKALLKEIDDWAPSLKDLIRSSDEGTIVARPIYALPTGTTWGRVPGVTVVGDAAHVMSPFAGEGANLALIDGADLARAIINEPDLDAAVVAYEKRMLPRAKKAAAASQSGLNMMFVDGRPRKLIAMFRTMTILDRVTKPVTRLFASPRKG